jgi:DNA repair exonuclease SbcCD ATPase subunit
MHDLKFTYLAARNFICFGPEGIEIDLGHYGNIVLIRGENHDRQVVTEEGKVYARNGVGKSSIPEILVVTLYGKTIRKEKKLTQENVINNLIGKKMRTEVRWGNFRVVRTRKPNTLRIWENPERVWPGPNEKEDEEFNKKYEKTLGGIPATQALIEEKIGLSYEAFVNTVVFTDNNSGSFLECDTPTKREIVENLLSLAPYREYLERAKKTRNAQKDKVASMATNYERLLGEADIAAKRIDKIKAQEVEWRRLRKEELSALIRKIKSKQEELSKSDSGTLLLKYNEAQEQIKELSESLPKLQDNVDRIKIIVQTIKKKQDDLRTERNVAAAEVDKADMAMLTVSQQIKASEGVIASFEAKKDTQCPSCLGVVSEENYHTAVESARSEIEVNKKEIERMKGVQAKAQAKLDTALAGEKSLAKALAEAETKAKEMSRKMDTARREINEKSRIQRPDVGAEERVMQEMIAEWKKQAIAKDEECKGPSPYVEVLKSAEEESAFRKTECSERKAELVVAEKELPYYEFWVKAFGDTGIRKFVIDGIIPALNARINYWLQFLIDGKIKLTFDNELNELIEAQPADGDPFIYYAMSGGERRRLNLAVSQAFAYVMMLNSGSSPSVVFLDEVTSNIDPQGVEGVFNMIQELAKDKQVFVTTHDHDLLDILAGCPAINLVRKDGFTSLVG